MAEHVVCRVEEIAEGKGLRVELEGRAIAVFNLGERFAAVADRCPHEGASLCHGRTAPLTESQGPGDYRVIDGRIIVRCPWHGWEFDLATGRSYCDPNRVRVRSFDVRVADSANLVEGPYRVETFEVTTRGRYVVVTV